MVLREQVALVVQGVVMVLAMWRMVSGCPTVVQTALVEPMVQVVEVVAQEVERIQHIHPVIAIAFPPTGAVVEEVEVVAAVVVEVMVVTVEGRL